MQNTTIPLFIIGKPAPNHLNYYNECRRIAGPNVTFVDFLPRQELCGIYKAARVHAMPSWFETTGLSSLEAAAMGCNVVISEKGNQREYFKDYAFYCDPNDIDSIRLSILKAYETPINPSFREYIIKNYTWEKAAEKTLEPYNLVFNRQL